MCLRFSSSVPARRNKSQWSWSIIDGAGSSRSLKIGASSSSRISRFRSMRSSAIVVKRVHDRHDLLLHSANEGEHLHRVSNVVKALAETNLWLALRNIRTAFNQSKATNLPRLCAFDCKLQETDDGRFLYATDLHYLLSHALP